MIARTLQRSVYEDFIFSSRVDAQCICVDVKNYFIGSKLAFLRPTMQIGVV